MIRWISPRLGTAPWNDSEIAVDIERVDVRDLVDRSGNADAPVLDKIRRATEILASGRKVVVCCDLGMSRSNAIAAGVLSRTEGITLAEAVARVVAATNESRIKVDVVAAVARALATADRPTDSQISSRVLLIGGNGFVGRRLAARLADRCQVLAPGRTQADLSAGAVSLYLSAVGHEAGTIVHLARPRVVDNTGVGEAVTMLRNTLDVCREIGAGLVFLSGEDVFSGHTRVDRPATEDLPRRPGNHLGEMHALCEDLIGFHEARYGLRVLLLRCPTLYDDDGTRPYLVRKFVDLALRGDQIVTHRYRNGPPRLDLVHVDDAVSAVAELIARGETGALHLGAADTIATVDLATRIVELTASTSRVFATDIDADCANIVLDGSRLAAKIGWRPRVGFAASLPRTIGRIKQQKDAVQ